MKRYVIGFGYERDRDNALTGLGADDAARVVESLADEIRLPAYALRFGPGSWVNDQGVRVTEQGGTVEFVAEGLGIDGALAERMARGLKEKLRQDAVVFYVQPVETFTFI